VIAVNQASDNVTVFASSGDDEDGVTFSPQTFVPGRSASAVVTASAAGNLSAWFDWNRDGDWSDAGERVIADEPLTAGVNRVFFVVPIGASTGGTFARFRLSERMGLSFAGPGGAGEVEDYRITVATDGGATSIFTNPEVAEDVSADGAVTLNAAD
jgi:hypothetical protein